MKIKYRFLSHFMILNSRCYHNSMRLRGPVNLSIGLSSHYKIVHGAYRIRSRYGDILRLAFLGATKHLYKRVCPSLRTSVGP